MIRTKQTTVYPSAYTKQNGLAFKTYSVTYMPGSSRWSLPQHQVGNGTLWLVSPFQRRGVVESEVTVWQQQWIKEHRYGVGRPPFQPLAQVLQVLQREHLWGSVHTALMQLHNFTEKRKTFTCSSSDRWGCSASLLCSRGFGCDASGDR